MTTTQTLRKILYEIDRNRNARIFVIYGGQGAGKTFAISQIILEELLTHKYTNTSMVVGFELSKLKNRAYSDFRNIAAAVPDIDMMMNECRLANGNRVKFIGLDTDTVGLSVRTQYLFFNEFSEFKRYEDIKPLVDRCNGLVFIDTNPMKFAADNIRRLREDYGDMVAEVKVTYRDNEFLPEGEVQMIEAKRTVGKNARIGSRARWEYEVFVLGNFAEIEVGEVFEFTDFQPVDPERIQILHTYGIIDPSARVGGDGDNCARAVYGVAIVGGEERIVLLDSATDNTSTMPEIADEQMRWRKLYGNFTTYCECNGYGRDFAQKLSLEIGRNNVGGYLTTAEKFTKIWDNCKKIKDVLFVNNLQNAKFLRNVCSFSASCAHDDEADNMAQAVNYDWRRKKFTI